MAPGKKHKHHQQLTPRISYAAHPSLSSKSTPVIASPVPTKDDAASVSERIKFLREVQRPKPSSVADLENSMATMKVQSPSRSRIPGSPRPRSWLEGDASGTESRHRARQTMARPKRRTSFPGIRVPTEGSLIDVVMKAMAVNIDYHWEVDHLWMSALPVELKAMLLGYIARLSPPRSLTVENLRTLFASQGTAGIEEATGTDGLDRLDVACSIGRSIRFSDLEALQRTVEKGKGGRAKSRDPSQKPTTSSEPELLDSWDLPDPELPRTISPGLCFPGVTKLALDFPGPQVSWTRLIEFSRHMHHLTHLSLAGWPKPNMSSESAHKEGYANSPASSGSTDRHELNDVLRSFARNTPSLTYLSLSDCHAWFEELASEPAVPSHSRLRFSRTAKADIADAFPTASAQVDKVWASHWRNLQTIDLSQSALLPPGLHTSELASLVEWRRGVKGPLHYGRDSLPQHRQPLPHALMRGGLPEQEIYTVTGPSSIVRDVENREARRRWLTNEIWASSNGKQINQQRHEAGLKVLTVDYGWGRKEVLDAGYSPFEADLVCGAGH